ncbi:TetR/AcrR family transcriptional regulator [Lactiplantibacillus pentosus]|uniref:TetR/AcrR family transcriptional regulator n=1 Tax=Lactiplantibacillus pentosus TaxID=1589 RepID=UPI000EA8F1DC|nr:TetR/AcrR family transcriptional regulator [Lactiplantibacillus pentosus]AYG37339.1 TetR/AcrR family transcriptional regulator [Lactiplantibacillus pentosus]AYG39995.1 TetR/AcrR family transcriptional regulator [Lactiplantibacillus pentosus]MCJ8179703.1 TetR/AcrR family transcriptional regulator [Lactiplantibacillus pentosus]
MRKTQERKARIVQLARELFTKYGYQKTTMRQISKTAHMAEGLIYYYFPHGKQEILNNVIVTGMNNRIQLVNTNKSAPLNLKETYRDIEKMFTTLWNAFQDRDNYQSFLITVHERVLLTDAQSKWLEQMTGSIERQITMILKSSTDFLESNTDIYLLADVIVSIFQKSIFNNILLRGQREVPSQEKRKALIELHVVLNSFRKMKSSYNLNGETINEKI